MNNPYSQDPAGNQHNDGAQYASYGGEKQSNPLGIVGFVLALTCLLAPIGLIVSIIALFKRPRGFAIAGTVIGLVLSSALLLSGGTVWALLKYGKGGMAVGIFEVQKPVLEQQINAYLQETGGMPSSLDQVHLPDAARIDPWGTPYRFNADTPGPGSWTISSAGPDRQFGTSDDINDLIAFADADGSIVQGWVEAAQQNPDDWPGFREIIRIGSEIGNWQGVHDGRSAVAGQSTPLPADPPADTPADPTTP